MENTIREQQLKNRGLELHSWNTYQTPEMNKYNEYQAMISGVINKYNCYAIDKGEFVRCLKLLKQSIRESVELRGYDNLQATLLRYIGNTLAEVRTKAMNVVL